MKFNLTLHAVASMIGTRLGEGPATLADLVAAVVGIDGLTELGARRVVRRFLAGLRAAGRVVREGGEWRMA